MRRKKIVEMLEGNIREITSIPEKKMIHGKEKAERLNKETRCWICNGKFTGDVKKCKVGDHCHFTGRYRRAAHKTCNFLYKKPTFTPVVFNNLREYDSHLFVKNHGCSDNNIDCIFYTEERYISFTKKIQDGSHTRKQNMRKEKLSTKLDLCTIK